jgi:hypothetical protein
MAHLSKQLRKHLSDLGKKGGLTAAKRMTKQQRIERARKASAAAAAKRAKQK